MITGRFGDTSGAPFIEGRIHLPRLGISGNVSFLMDTGADTTTLMPDDTRKLGISFDALEGDMSCVGVGGPVHCYTEDAVLIFSSPGVALYVYELKQLCIMPDDPQMSTVYSLLGRDVLDNWRITYHPSAGKLNASVIKADLVLDVNPEHSPESH